MNSENYIYNPGRATIWRLLERRAIELTSMGNVPFTRGDLIKGVQLKNPNYQENSINPIIQGLTDNLKGGAPGAVGKNILHSVGRGQFVLRQSDKNQQANPLYKCKEWGQPKVSNSFNTAASTKFSSYKSTTPKSTKKTDLDLANSLVLVSCVKSKLPYVAPARDLYSSTLFNSMKRLVEASGASWLILSAKHELVDPDTILAPYELTLKSLGVAKRRAWAKNVLEQLLPIAKDYRRIVIFAGISYREFLVGPLEQNGLEVVIPMEGLGFGHQLAWLAERK